MNNRNFVLLFPAVLLLGWASSITAQGWKRATGPTPFSISLPKGFAVESIEAEPPESGSFRISKNKRAYLYVAEGQFIVGDFSMDAQGKINPLVQQRVICAGEKIGGGKPPIRQILYVNRLEDPVQNSDLVLVLEPLGLPPHEQTEMDEIVRSIHTRSGVGPVADPLLSCPTSVGAVPNRSFFDSPPPPKR